MEKAGKIGEILAEAGYRIGADTEEKFEKYLRYLTEYNRKVNLTSIDPSDAPAGHFADSLAAADLIPCGASVVDIGSGGGFPGVPLKIFRDDIRLTALDSNGRKCSFLRSLSAALGLKFDVLCARAEDIGLKEYRGCFEIGVTRAVAELRILAEIGLPLIKTGGRLLCYKGRLGEPELSSGIRAAEKCGGRIVAENRYSLYGAERCLVVIDKVSETPAEFPRRFKKMVSTPL